MISQKRNSAIPKAAFTVSFSLRPHHNSDCMAPASHCTGPKILESAQVSPAPTMAPPYCRRISDLSRHSVSLHAVLRTHRNGGLQL